MRWSWAVATLVLILPGLVTAAPAAQLTSFEIPRAAAQWKRAFIKAQREVWGLNTPAWLAAQVGQESGFRDGLTSSVGARGLTQFMPGTAAGMERLYPDLVALGRYSPQWAFRAQALLTRDLYREFGKDRDPCNGAKHTLAGYNGSPSTLRKEVALCAADFPNCDSRLWDENVATKRARIPAHWHESRTYVFRIMQREKAYADSGWGVLFCGSPKSPAPETVAAK